MKKYVCLALSCFVLLSTASCTKKNKTQTSNDYYGTIKPKHNVDEIWINNREEPQHMDPTLATGVSDFNLIMNSFSRLVQIDPKTSKPIGDLALSWDVSEEGKRYIFHLRKDLKWSDGHPLTAHDFEYSWKRLMDPSVGSQYASLAYSSIEGGEAFGRQAVVLSGFAKAPRPSEIQSYLVSKGIAVEKVSQRSNSTDIFVFVGGTDKDQMRKRILQIFSQHTYFGKIEASVADSSVVEVRALGDLEFEVRLVGPLPYFVLLAEYSSFAAVPKHVIERVKAENDGDASRWTKLGTMVFSGPYMLVHENFKIDKVYEKNPQYWDASNVRTPRIRVLMIETETALMNAYKVGEVDVFGPHEVPSEMVAEVSKFKDFYDDPYLGVYYYIMNTAVKPLDNPLVRQALALAIDRESLTKNVLGGGYKAYHGFVPDGLAGYKSVQNEMYNPEKARELLAEAGFSNGEGFPKLKFKYDTKDVHRLVAQAVQEMWKKNLNVEFEMSNVEWKIYLDDLHAKRFELSRWGWIGDFLDPFTFLELMLSDSGNNHTQWASPEYDELIHLANTQSDESKRLALFQQAESLIMQEQVVIPLFLYTKTYMLKPYIKGFYKDYQDHHPWKHMWIDLDWEKSPS